MYTSIIMYGTCRQGINYHLCRTYDISECMNCGQYKCNACSYDFKTDYDSLVTFTEFPEMENHHASCPKTQRNNYPSPMELFCTFCADAVVQNATIFRGHRYNSNEGVDKVVSVFTGADGMQKRITICEDHIQTENLSLIDSYK